MSIYGYNNSYMMKLPQEIMQELAARAKARRLTLDLTFERLFSAEQPAAGLSLDELMKVPKQRRRGSIK